MNLLEEGLLCPFVIGFAEESWPAHPGSLVRGFPEADAAAEGIPCPGAGRVRTRSPLLAACMLDSALAGLRAVFTCRSWRHVLDELVAALFEQERRKGTVTAIAGTPGPQHTGSFEIGHTGAGNIFSSFM